MVRDCQGLELKKNKKNKTMKDKPKHWKAKTK